MPENAIFGDKNEDFEISLESDRKVPETRRIEEIFGLAGRQVDENCLFRHFCGEGIEIASLNFVYVS